MSILTHIHRSENLYPIHEVTIKHMKCKESVSTTLRGFHFVNHSRPNVFFNAKFDDLQIDLQMIIISYLCPSYHTAFYVM